MINLDDKEFVRKILFAYAGRFGRYFYIPREYESKITTLSSERPKINLTVNSFAKTVSVYRGNSFMRKFNIYEPDSLGKCEEFLNMILKPGHLITFVTVQNTWEIDDELLQVLPDDRLIVIKNV